MSISTIRIYISWNWIAKRFISWIKFYQPQNMESPRDFRLGTITSAVHFRLRSAESLLPFHSKSSTLINRLPMFYNLFWNHMNKDSRRYYVLRNDEFQSRTFYLRMFLLFVIIYWLSINYVESSTSAFDMTRPCGSFSNLGSDIDIFKLLTFTE